MQVLRKQEMEVNEVLIGDQITMKLKGFGEFTATAQKITDDGILFMFDDCVAERQMNKEWTNKGGYEVSDLCVWLESELLPTFPDDLRSKVTSISLPTCGQMFNGEDLEWCRERFEDDGDEQLDLMKIRRNRVADFGDNDYTWYWLKNPTKQDVSASSFAHVHNYGNAGNSTASSSLGVRPVFWLVR